jgi:hypothetical protein
VGRKQDFSMLNVLVYTVKVGLQWNKEFETVEFLKKEMMIMMVKMMMMMMMMTMTTTIITTG